MTNQETLNEDGAEDGWFGILIQLKRKQEILRREK